MKVRWISVVDFSLDDYEHQLDLALSPLISAAKLVVTRTSQVVIGVVVFVIAVHVASAVLRYYFRLAEGPRGDVGVPRNVYVTAHAPHYTRLLTYAAGALGCT